MGTDPILTAVAIYHCGKVDWRQRAILYGLLPCKILPFEFAGHGLRMYGRFWPPNSYQTTACTGRYSHRIDLYITLSSPFELLNLVYLKTDTTPTAIVLKETSVKP